MSVATPEWAELLQMAVAAQLFEVHTCMPGQIVTVHTGGQSVDVRPCLRRALPNDDDTAAPFFEEELPILPRVPVGFMQGGGFFVSVPLKAGDFVTLVFAERSIDRWLATARKSTQTAVSTGDVGTHSLDGAIALPMGPAPSTEVLNGVSATDLVIGFDGGRVIHVTPGAGGEIHLGSVGGADYVALAAKVATELNRIKSDISTLKGAVSTALNNIAVAAGSAYAGSAVAGPFNSATASVPSNPASVAASKVKAD